MASDESSGLLSLPFEILHGVGFKLDDQSNQLLRLVCQRIRLAIEPQAFAVLKLTANNRLRLIERLEAYGTRKSRVGSFVRKLVLRIATVEEEEHGSLQTLFQKALYTLENVRGVSWISEDTEPSWVTEILPVFIQSRAAENLDVDITFAHTDFSTFNAIGDLRSFRFRSWPSTDIDDMYHAAQIIQKSPRLSELEISTSCYSATSHSPRFMDFLPPVESPALPLKRVRLQCLRILLDDTTLRHFRSLKSLTIRHNLITPQFGSTYTQIWDTLRNENIHLTEIALNLGEIEDALLSYLMSYKGVESLVFNSEHQWYEPHKAGRVAQRFFADVIPTNVESLERLTIISHMDNGWCFGEQNSEAFEKCRRLRELDVSIRIQAPHEEESRRLFGVVKSKMVFLERWEIHKAIRWTDPQSG